MICGWHQTEGGVDYVCLRHDHLKRRDDTGEPHFWVRSGGHDFSTPAGNCPRPEGPPGNHYCHGNHVEFGAEHEHACTICGIRHTFTKYSPPILIGESYKDLVNPSWDE